ncbi:MAG: T9SS type A sorting domain-containing protein, partial [Eudoraea sp.]|nr:T9SS type A sorting domain-containing protein [Eudoraea sp.]
PPPPPPPSGGNSDPTVNITSPNNGQVFDAGSTVTVGVSASDSDGSIVKHQVFVNGALKDTDGANYTPYQISNIAAGSYAIRVTVTDNDGATASATVNITVGSGAPPPPPPPSGGNNAPTLAITSPNNGQNFAAGSNVSINLSASDSDGTVVKHQIFVNNVLRDTDGTFFTPYVINNIAAGSYAIRGEVTDNDGAKTAVTVNITVGSGNPPPPPPSGGGITFSLINASTNNAISTLSNGGNISSPNDKNIRANSSFNGTKSVYFRLSGRLNRVWTENAAPYALFADNGGNYVGVNFPSGSYTLLAEAWSGSNRTGNKLGSATINFTAGTSTAKSAIGQVYVYPNPIVNGRFSVKVPEEVVGDVFYSLISTSGAEVETGKVSVERAGDNAEFNLDSFDNKNNGVYYLILQSKGSSYTVPLIKK